MLADSALFSHAVAAGTATYDMKGVLDYIDSNPMWFAVAAFISFSGAYMQYFGAIRDGFRDRSYSIAFGANMWFFAHDTTYVSRYNDWFNVIDHWTVKAFWFALLLFALLEATVTYQALRYKHDELFPGLTRRQAVCAYIPCQIGIYLLLWWFQSMVSDPLYWICFLTTVVLSSLWNIPLMLRRGTREGMSWTLLIGISLLSGGYYWWLWLIDPYFKQPLLVAIAVLNMVLCAAVLVIFKRLPPYTPPDAVRGHRPKIRRASAEI